MLLLLLQILRWINLAAEIWIALPILYLCILSLAAIIVSHRRKAPSPEADTTRTNFAILIPAHNEELILGNLLKSLKEVTYPEEHYTIYVIADNCTDTTAELARAVPGVKVYERFDQVKRGKGYALNWLLGKLEEEQLIHDAYLILDADSVVVPTFLTSMHAELAKGAVALQACNTVLNVTDSPSTALRWVALTLINHIRPLGRNAIGGSSTLTGNGMCLSRALLQKYPWQAFSVSEDYQYYLMLVQEGYKVRYVPEAVVRSQMPTSFAQMRTQDIRWEASEGSNKTQHKALRLLGAGLKFHDFVRLEAVAELLAPPLSFLIFWCTLTLLASVLLWSPIDIIAAFLLIAGLLFYLSSAFYVLRPPKSVYLAFLHAPGFLLWKLWVYFVLRKKKKYSSEWVRTARNAS